jgi:GT2 family glycosyltransferase
VLVVGRVGDEPTKEVFEGARSDLLASSTWLEVETPGHLPPVMAGVAAADTAIVALLDDDAEPSSEWLRRLIAPFQDPRVAVVGGQYLRPGQVAASGRVQDAGRFRWYGRFVGHFASLGPIQSVPCDGVLEGTSAWRRDVLEQVGFDDFFLSGDAFHFGLDLSQGAHRLGYKVLYVPGAETIHHWARRPGDATPRDARARAYVAGRNMTYVGLKHFRGARRVAFVVWWCLLGERQCYGVMTALLDGVSGHASVIGTVRAAFRGRADGARAWWGGRRRR